MVDKLHEQGFLVTVWVMPFLQEGFYGLFEARSLGYVIEGGDPSINFTRRLPLAVLVRGWVQL